MNSETSVYLPDFVTFARINQNLAVLSSPLEKHQLRGDSVEIVEEVLPLLREGASAKDIATSLDIPEGAADQILQRLFDTGLLRVTDPEDDYFEWGTSDPDTARNNVADSTVVLLSPVETPASAAWNDQPFTLMEIDSITALREEAPAPDLIVSVVNGSRPAFHRALAEYAYESDIDWLPSRLVGGEIRLGPLMKPGQGACYNCYYERSLASVDQPAAVGAAKERQETEERHPNYPEPIVGLQHVATRLEVLHITSADRRPTTEETVLAIDALSFDRSSESVLKLPGCEVCGQN